MPRRRISSSTTGNQGAGTDPELNQLDSRCWLHAVPAMSESSAAKAVWLWLPMRSRRVSMEVNVTSLFVGRKQDCAAGAFGYRATIESGNLPPMTEMTESEERAALVERLRAAREAAGYRTQQSMADVLGISQQRYSNWENGGYLPNEVRLLRRLCAALDVTADYLLLGSTAGLSRTTYTKLIARNRNSS